MNYQEAVRYISEIQKNLGSDYSLEPVKRLCELAGRPDRNLRIIHIAGTNGKGSIGTFLSNILAWSGYTVGRYVSPTLFEYRERIQRIEGKADSFCCTYISEQEVAEGLTQLRSLVQQMEQEGMAAPTAFEIETVMAFQTMRQWGVDVAVIETGMGGRTDATNIIEHPLLCLFAHISLDHTAWLGNTLEEIAAEKYGILKKGADVVTVRQEESCMKLLEERCQELGVPLMVADQRQVERIQYAIDGTAFFYQGEALEIEQAGTYQVENALAAWEAAKILQKKAFPLLSSQAVKQALRQTRWKGRFERIALEPDIIVDGAHNPQAAVELRRSLEKCFPGEAFTFVMGMFRDKDYSAMLEIMLPLAERVYTVTPPGERGLPAEELALQIAEGHGIPCSTVFEALRRACEERERIVVFGSLSFLHEVYEYAEKSERRILQ